MTESKFNFFSFFFFCFIFTFFFPCCLRFAKVFPFDLRSCSSSLSNIYSKYTRKMHWKQRELELHSFDECRLSPIPMQRHVNVCGFGKYLRLLIRRCFIQRMLNMILLLLRFLQHTAGGKFWRKTFRSFVFSPLCLCHVVFAAVELSSPSYIPRRCLLVISVYA